MQRSGVRSSSGPLDKAFCDNELRKAFSSRFGKAQAGKDFGKCKSAAKSARHRWSALYQIPPRPAHVLGFPLCKALSCTFAGACLGKPADRRPPPRTYPAEPQTHPDPSWITGLRDQESEVQKSEGFSATRDARRPLSLHQQTRLLECAPRRPLRTGFSIGNSEIPGREHRYPADCHDFLLFPESVSSFRPGVRTHKRAAIAGCGFGYWTTAAD